MSEVHLEDIAMPTASRRSELERATVAFEANLYDAREVLAARGIGEATARKYRLGVVGPDAPAAFARFEGMLSLPYLAPAGVVALKFRALDPEQRPKYNAPEGQPARLFNVAALHSNGDVVAICEGELDAVVMTELVGIPAVGVPGASNWQPWFPRCFSDYDTVLVVGDHDVREDGSSPGLKHAKRVVREVAGARLVLPPAGEDLNSWYLRDGREAVRNACGL